LVDERDITNFCAAFLSFLHIKTLPIFSTTLPLQLHCCHAGAQNCVSLWRAKSSKNVFWAKSSTRKNYFEKLKKLL
jgi:hypothetical protein